jgi:hypothetical protein
LRNALDSLYASGDLDEVAGRLAAELRRPFRRQTVLRLARLVVGTSAFFASFVYLLAWAAIPIATSAGWVGHPITTETVGLAGVDVVVPIGPYVSVAVLLALVATAAFLAFALTEDRYSTALSDLVLRQPAEACLRLSVPYVALAGLDPQT